MSVQLIPVTTDTGRERIAQKPNLQNKIDKFQARVENIKSNVRPETCLLAAATIILSIVKGKKIADFALKGAAIAQSFLHVGLKKAGGNISATVKGMAKKGFDKKGYLDNIKTATDKILQKGKDRANNIGTPNEKFVNNIKDYVNIFCKDNQETGNKVTKFITENMGINSKTGLLTGALAGLFGWKVGDGSGDALEAVLDNREIQKVHDEIFS